MRKLRHLSVLAAAFLLACCVWHEPSDPLQEPVYEVEAPRIDVITLQNLRTRVLIHCMDSDYASAEMCARNYERAGYVRLTDIPAQTADKDFLKADTYPTRRWRRDELVPRW